MMQRAVLRGALVTVLGVGAAWTVGCSSAPPTGDEASDSQQSAATSCPTASNTTQRQQQLSAVLRYMQGGAWETVLNKCTNASATATVAQVQAEATYWRGQLASGKGWRANQFQYTGTGGPTTAVCGVSADPVEVLVGAGTLTLSPLTTPPSPFTVKQASAKSLIQALTGCYGSGIEGFIATDAAECMNGPYPDDQYYNNEYWCFYKVTFFPTVGGSRWPTFRSYAPFQQNATRVLQSMLGSPNVMPADLGCEWINQLASWYRGQVTTGAIRGHYPLGSTTIQGLPAVGYRFEEYVASQNYAHSLSFFTARMRWCYGSQIAPFSLLGTGTGGYDSATGSYYAYYDTDPEAAILDASLGSTNAASAAAHGENSGAAATVFRFGTSTLSASGRSSWVGQNCVNGTATYNAGARAPGIVTYANSPTNTYLKCAGL